jgi:hypothetical protein
MILECCNPSENSMHCTTYIAKYNGIVLIEQNKRSKNTSQHNHVTCRVSYHLTNHLGYSGMKKSPTSRTTQGINPT